jgi:ribosomal protein L37AE/L43A
MTRFGGGFDGDLSSKIDQLLAGRPSAKQKVEEFLVEELHVDPSKLPISLKDARKLINDKMAERDSNIAWFQGSSMGLTHVRFDKNDNSNPTCPTCGNDYNVSLMGANQYECEDCEKSFTWTKATAKFELVNERSNKALWDDMLRCYNAFVKGVHAEDDPSVDFTKFQATHTWGEAAVIGTKDKPIKWKRPGKYPVGTSLRVTDGTNFEWVRVGGPFSDEDLVNLATMKPMKDSSKWTVVEVLDVEANAP